ncbi:hypothetical protein BD408DRAFT_469009, partial [Parasitella parasitica]
EILCKLPIEIWIAIFQNLSHDDHNNPNIKTLSECRQVCQLWNCILESDLLGKASLMSTANFHKFKDAFKDRPYVRCFKQLRICNNENLVNGFNLELYNMVMGLAFTPNLTTVEGFFENEDFYKVLIEIVESSDAKFDKLKYVPIPDGVSPLYNRLVLNLTDFLEKIYVDFTYPCDESDTSDENPNTNLIDHFGKFKKLKTTTICGLQFNRFK